MQRLLQDIRYGVRMLLKQLSFTLIAVVTLALGIGATTSIFSVVNGVLLRPLPYPDADRLVSIGQKYKADLAGAGEPKFLFWREHARSFDAMAAYSHFGGAGGNLSGGSEPEYVDGVRVSSDFFRVLGVYPAVGRALTAEEDTPGAERVAIISDGLWKRRFEASRDVIGLKVLLNDQPVVVIGVMPEDFRFHGGIDLFVPMQPRPTANYDPNATVIGRLKSDVTLAQARSEMATIADEYRALNPKQMQPGESAGAQPYKELLTGEVRNLLWILFAAVSFLLLIACANVANLQLTRAAVRQREIAVRVALGASGARIVRQLLTEGVLLSLVGGAAGLLLAIWGTDLLLAIVPQGLLPRVAVIGTDWRVLVFSIVAALGTGILFGMAPAWQARNVDVNTTLKEQGRGGTSRGKLRSALIVTEVALSLVLLAGAGLLIRTFTNLSGVAPGFDPHNVLTSQIALNGPRYNTTAKAAAFYRDALERIQRVPGVEAAAVINKLPLDWQFNMPVVFPESPDQLYSEQVRITTPDYFKVMRIPVRSGRAFTESDTSSAQPVVLINEAFANRYFKEKDPLTMQLSVGRGLDDPLRQVIGIVGDTKQHSLDRPAPPMVFIPLEQVPDKLMAIVRTFTAGNFAVRTNIPPLALAGELKKVIADIDPTLSLSELHSMDEIAERSVATQRFNMQLLGLFACLGLLLAAVGIYGVVAYVVEQRTREIGLRIALGAQTSAVMRLIVRLGLSLTFLGVVLGVAASAALTRLMSSLLFGVSAFDPATFGAISLLLFAVAILACWIPARRAARVDPMVALRYE